MTYIEFYDKVHIENLCSSLITPPERIVLIGERSKLLEKQAKRYADILQNRGIHTEFICKSVNKKNMQDVEGALEAVVASYEDCTFDLTGGDEVFLVAVGIIFERYRAQKNIQMHYINIRNGSVLDCDLDGRTLDEKECPKISVQENIRIYGGDIVFDQQAENSTPKWDLSDDFIEDIYSMWDICKVSGRMWNGQIGVFMAAEELGGLGPESLTTTVPMDFLERVLESHEAKYYYYPDIIQYLSWKGLAEVHEEDDTFSIHYKNPQVKKCLTLGGQALEMIIYLSALQAESKGDQVYNDVLNGVYIDWDGDIHPDLSAFDTGNEVDVIMMHGMVPVFVSCKNGFISKEELYKLNTVAEKFGGPYAKKVLVATALDDSPFAEYFRQRARDMNIRVVEGVQNMDNSELIKVVGSFWGS